MGSQKTRKDAERRKRRQIEAKEKGLTYRAYMALRNDLGLGRQTTAKKKDRPEPLIMSAKAVELVNAERLNDRRQILIRADIPCPKLRFEDIAAADSALQRMWDEGIMSEDDLYGLESYRCYRCAGAHLGHSY
jgi:hypothetical protein